MESCNNNISPIDPNSSYVENIGNPIDYINSLSDLFSRRCIESTPPETYLLEKRLILFKQNQVIHVPTIVLKLIRPYQCQTHIETKITCEIQIIGLIKTVVNIHGINAVPMSKSDRPQYGPVALRFNKITLLWKARTSSNNLILSSGDSPEIIRMYVNKL